MGKIELLTPLVANMIAAGEVLERPSSAVKELVENSIDAGADRIIVEIENGGKTRIKVTDNGCGMTPEDAKNSFLRHATSKIRKADDLSAISTMGFRGEALASIAAVSKVSMITRTADSIEGFEIHIEAGNTVYENVAGCGAGTSIEIKDLFFNTPARMKFLKSENTESALIAETIERFIIAYPHISFKLIKNGREVIYSSGDNDSLSNLKNIYHREITDNLTAVDYETEGIKITGYVGNEKILKPGRKYQMFFVNGRIVRNKIFFAAVDEAMKEKAVSGQHPFVILDIKISPEFTDVNVHPTKAEIKFSDDRLIFGSIVSALNSAVRVEGMETSVKEKPVKEEYENIEFIKSPEINKNDVVSFNLFKTSEPAEKEYNSYFNEVKTQKFEALKPVVNEPEVTYEKEEIKAEPVKEVIPDYKIIGQVFDTYVIIEKDDNMYLLDQHAAHERLIYDRILKEISEKELITQQLLVPIIINLSPVEQTLICENKELFSSMGFDIEDFGGSSIAVREIPFDMTDEDISGYFADMAEILSENKTAGLTAKQQKAVATLACKAAIKGNNRFSGYELSALVEDVIMKQSANTCPHGRPLFAKFDKKTIDKQFRRII